MSKHGLRLGLILSIIFITGGFASAQEEVDDLSLSEARQAALEKYGITEIPDLAAVRSFAAQIFSQELERQNEDELERLSEAANRVANLIGYIYDEYDYYYRANYRFDFVREKVAPHADSYNTIRSEFLRIRNQAYFNLGILAKQNGRTMEAFFYFRDAFRLSIFGCSKGKTGCMRWQAEQEMQKLLGLSHIKAYVYWKE